MSKNIQYSLTNKGIIELFEARRIVREIIRTYGKIAYAESLKTYFRYKMDVYANDKLQADPDFFLYSHLIQRKFGIKVWLDAGTMFGEPRTVVKLQPPDKAFR